MNDTITFSIGSDKEQAVKRDLKIVYDALKEKGYNPINQLVGYLLSEDPTYITTYKDARSTMCRIDRDDLLRALIENYISGK